MFKPKKQEVDLYQNDDIELEELDITKLNKPTNDDNLNKPINKDIIDEQIEELQNKNRTEEKPRREIITRRNI